MFASEIAAAVQIKSHLFNHRRQNCSPRKHRWKI